MGGQRIDLVGNSPGVTAGAFSREPRMEPNAWRDFLRKAYAQRPRITHAAVEISGSKVTVDWSGQEITANGKKAGETMSWPENDAWNIIHNLSVAAK